MKKYHKLKYELVNMLTYLYNKHYLFILDNWSKNGYIIINNKKKDMVMNCSLSIYNDINNECIIDTSGSFAGDNQIKISYNKQIKITLPKNNQDLKIVITNINYVPDYLDLKIISNIISYKDLFLSKCSTKKYDELYNPKRDNLYIEKDIINKYYGSQYRLKVLSDYIQLLNDKIKNGIIVNRNQIQKLGLCSELEDNKEVDNKEVNNEAVDNEKGDNEGVDNEGVCSKEEDNEKGDNEGVCSKEVDNEGVCSKEEDNEGVCSKEEDNEGVCSKEVDNEVVCNKEEDNEGVCNKEEDNEGVCNKEEDNERVCKKYLKIVYENIINKDDDNIFKLLIVVHIGSRELGIEIINKFINTGINDTYLYCFNINDDINGDGNDDINSDENDDINILIKTNFKNYIISSTINFGNDIIPSLLLYNYVNSKYKVQYILKIQTKGNRIWFDGNINILITEHINKILYIFDNSNIDSIGSKKFLVKMDKYNLDLLQVNNNNMEDILTLERKKFIKIILNLPYDFDYNNYKKNNYEILCKYFNKKKISNLELIKHYLKVGKKQNYSYKNCNNINFFAGTMFFCKKKIFDNMINKYIKLINASIINNFYYDNELISNSSPIHALERLFGYYYNNIPITFYKKPKLFISYVGTNKTNINKLNDLNVDKLMINGNYTESTSGRNSDSVMDAHYLNISNLFNINNMDSNGYTLLISDNIKSHDIDYIYNYLHFNTCDFISYNEIYTPQYHFPIRPMWILKNKLIDKFMNMYKKNKITFLLDFSNMVLADYNPKTFAP
jgi:hypothetical protein